MTIRNTALEGQLGHAANALEDAKTYIRLLEWQLQAAYDYMTGEWVPDDQGRHRYIARLKDILETK